MEPGGPPMGPPPGEMSDKAKAELTEPKPKSIREVPRYILNITKKFFFRLFYQIVVFSAIDNRGFGRAFVH